MQEKMLEFAGKVVLGVTVGCCNISYFTKDL